MAATWGGRRAVAALDWVRAKGRRENLPCCICRQPIDYSLRGDPEACSVQHIKSRNLYPELTWVRSNWGPAHLRCNTAAGDGSRALLDLGATY